MSTKNNKLGTSLKLHFKCLNGTTRTLELSNNDDCTLEQIIKLLFNKKILKPCYGYDGISKIKLVLSSKSNPEGKIKCVELKQSVLKLFNTMGQDNIVIYIVFGLFDKNIKEQSSTLKSLTEINTEESGEPKQLLKSVFKDHKGTEFTLKYLNNDKLKLIELIQLLLDKKMLQQDSGTTSVILSRGWKKIDLQENCQVTSCLEHWDTTCILYGTLNKTMDGKTITLEDLENSIPENDKQNKSIQPILTKNKIQPSENLTSQSNPQDKSLQIIFKDPDGIRFTLEVDCNNNYQWSEVMDLLFKKGILCDCRKAEIRFAHKGRLINPKEQILNIFQNNKENQFIDLNVKIDKSVNNNMMTLESLLNTNQINNNQDKQLIHTKTEKQTITPSDLKDINDESLKHTKKNHTVSESCLIKNTNYINNAQCKQLYIKQIQKETTELDNNRIDNNLKHNEKNIGGNFTTLDTNHINNAQKKQVIGAKIEQETTTPSDQQNIVCSNLNDDKIKKGTGLRILGFICIVGGASISAIKLFGICKIGAIFVIIPVSLLTICGLLLIFNVEIFGKLSKKPEISDNDSKINNQEQISIAHIDVRAVPKTSKETDNTVNRIGGSDV